MAVKNERRLLEFGEWTREALGEGGGGRRGCSPVAGLHHLEPSATTPRERRGEKGGERKRIGFQGRRRGTPRGASVPMATPTL
jgi:hypothetical protein